MDLRTKKKIFISAGDFSGDFIAADLVLALRQQLPNVFFFGLVGPALRSAGVDPIGDQKDLNFMGFFEVIGNLNSICLTEKYLLAAIDRVQPDVAILVDYPGLHFRLAEQLKVRGIKVIQYVAPKIWAWGSGRIKQLERDFDLVLGVLPFESEFFLKGRVNYHYVGSPHVSRLKKIRVHKGDFALDAEKKIIACLPGSREDEITRHVPIILQTVQLLKEKFPDLIFAAPIPTSMEIGEYQDLIKPLLNKSTCQSLKQFTQLEGFHVQGVEFIHGASLELMAMSAAAIIASGTATLEAALLNVPMAVIYSMSEFTYEIAKVKIKLKYFSLPNLILGQELVKEFIQNISAELLAKDIEELVFSAERRRRIFDGYESIRKQLDGDAAKSAAIKITQMLKLL
ncbi:MAG: lipid-A-disaccharide synthase [Oligoflexales bacterium]|nr:lipid-A-disaccharide synthase [Oligoflexales bacterium]